MANVRLTTHLYSFFPQFEGQDISVDATTVAEVVQEIERRAPGFAFYICDERGRLRQHVNIFVGDDRVVDRRQLTDAVGPESQVTIMQALSGG